MKLMRRALKENVVEQGNLEVMDHERQRTKVDISKKSSSAW